MDPRSIFRLTVVLSGWQAWINEDSVSRKAYIMTWMPAGVPGFLETSRITGMRKYHAQLRQALEARSPARAEIIAKDFVHGISEYGDKDGGEFWEEMFLPLPTPKL